MIKRGVFGMVDEQTREFFFQSTLAAMQYFLERLPNESPCIDRGLQLTLALPFGGFYRQPVGV
jgi:hypothetical protein